MKIEAIIFGIFGIGFLSIGIYLIFNALLTLLFGQASLKWPTVTGTIASSELKEGILRSGKKVYWASIKYKYSVNDHKYTGSRVGFSKYGVASRNSTKKEVAQTIIMQYPKEDEVAVYYLPMIPRLSTLEPGFNAIGFVGHFFLGIMFTVCVVYLTLKW